MPITHEDYVGNDTLTFGCLAQHLKAEGINTLTFFSPSEEADVLVPEEDDPAEDEGFPEDPFVHSTPAPASLTEEQQQRIELNKRQALERRLAKQKQLGVWSH